MALLARFSCGCTLRVEIPAPLMAVCPRHGARARLISLPSGQVRYETEQTVSPPVSGRPSEHLDQ